jgi:hypothetical protein
LGVANLFNKLTKPLSEPLSYPDKTKDLFKAVPFPVLNQPPAKVIARSALVPFLHELDWLVHYLSMVARLKIDVANRIAPGKQEPFKTYWDYAQILKTMREEQAKPIISFKIPFTVSVNVKVIYPWWIDNNLSIKQPILKTTGVT